VSIPVSISISLAPIAEIQKSMARMLLRHVVLSIGPSVSFDLPPVARLILISPQLF
jgi:hypothetical protein